MENSNDTGKIIGALLVGVAIGGVLGVLFAPDKGSETRKKIAAQGGDLSDAMRQKISGIQEQVVREIQKVKDRASELIENGAAKVDHNNFN